MGDMYFDIPLLLHKSGYDMREREVALVNSHYSDPI